MSLAASSSEADPLAPGPLASALPEVQLVNAFAEPFDNAVATARTCYAPRVIYAADVRDSERARAQRDAIARSTYEAGHHTTLQHATFQFVLKNVSRQCLWSFLHAHPFYNSEQVSQRYVAVRRGNALVPRLPARAAALYEATVQAQMTAYERLVELLQAPVAEAYFGIFRARRKQAERYAKAIKKRAQEVARSILPVATLAHLYHTVSGITLYRYHRLCGMLDVPRETTLVVAAMVDAVRRHDPLFFSNLEDPLPLAQTPEHAALASLGRPRFDSEARRFVQAFDRDLDGKTSVLLDCSARGEALLARAVRTVLGACPESMSDATAIARVLAPAHNRALAGALDLTSMSKLSRAMQHVHYTFAKKLSHSADSQDQRHRLTPGARPVLQTHYAGGEPDVIVPPLLARHGAALEVFMEAARSTWRAIDSLIDGGIDVADALYLLPNAFPIRFIESGSLMGWHHKWTTRLCYNAQDEIWRASVEEVTAVRAVHPAIGGYLGPPCSLRQAAGARPLCPEGPRYCGVPVWKYDVADFAREI